MNQSSFPELIRDNSEPRMSNFVTLLVEDDALQREVMADLLKDGGFEVVECTTAEAAELIVASTGAELQALVADQNLAGDMSGGDLARYARGRHPHLNIIVISGVTVPNLPARTTFLQKPFSPSRLLKAVRR
jgi:DNA-binding NtrC family response regulator